METNRTTEEGPRRLRRQRRRGCQWPQGAKFVGRPSGFANPFPSITIGKATAVALFDAWLDGRLDESDIARINRLFPNTGADSWIETMEPLRLGLLQRLHDLRGRDLICWCGEDEPCHANSLIRRANAIDTPRTDQSGARSPEIVVELAAVVGRSATSGR